MPLFFIVYRARQGIHSPRQQTCIGYYRYSKDGPLYINIRKSDGAKFQFHFETNQFMDADDEPVELKDIGLSEEIIDFYNDINPAFRPSIEYDYVGDFIDGFAIVALNSRWNFIDAEEQLLSKQWFDWVEDFEGGFGMVALDGKYNFIDKQGQLLSDTWFDDIYKFQLGNSFAKVELDGKYNFISKQGQLLSDQWFDRVRNIHDGVACVELNGKTYTLDTNGNITLQESHSASSPIITESILHLTIAECIRRILS